MGSGFIFVFVVFGIGRYRMGVLYTFVDSEEGKVREKGYVVFWNCRSLGL